MFAKEEKILIVSVCVALIFGSAAHYVRCRAPWQKSVNVSSVSPAVRTKPEITVNINSACAADLAALQGIGPKIAERIISYRNEEGPFVLKEDIMKVKGIGKGTFEKIRDNIDT